jgi:hypothetical protein
MAGVPAPLVSQRSGHELRRKTMTHEEREAEAQRLMSTLWSGGTPLTITETGETQDGAISDPTDEPALDFDVEYGVCPLCSNQGVVRNDGQLTVGREVWSVCAEHHVRWFSTFRSSSLVISEDEEQWDAHASQLERYKVMIGAAATLLWVAPDPEIVEQQEASYDRLWTIVRSTCCDQALLAWILETHTDLPQDLSWLIRRRMAEPTAARI